jgi:polyisoprenoid-binding protein YceI
MNSVDAANSRNNKWEINRRSNMRKHLIWVLAVVALPSLSRAQVPVFEVTPVVSAISFDVEASVALKGTFHKWESNFTCTSTDASLCVLEIKIQADSVDTGNGMKNGKLKSKDFFDVEQDPYITFKSTKIDQTSPTTFEMNGDFTIRGVTKAEKLNLTLARTGTDSGTVTGTMAFDRKDYGMNKSIPLVKIANRVEVSVDLKIKRVSGPPLVFKE